MKTDDIIAELIESWINGNRKYVAAEVAKRSRQFYTVFVIATTASADFTKADSDVFLRLVTEAKRQRQHDLTLRVLAVRKAKNAQHTKV